MEKIFQNLIPGYFRTLHLEDMTMASIVSGLLSCHFYPLSHICTDGLRFLTTKSEVRPLEKYVF